MAAGLFCLSDILYQTERANGRVPHTGLLYVLVCPRPRIYTRTQSTYAKLATARSELGYFYQNPGGL
jgi:hypothetical protein